MERFKIGETAHVFSVFRDAYTGKMEACILSGKVAHIAIRTTRIREGAAVKLLSFDNGLTYPEDLFGHTKAEAVRRADDCITQEQALLRIVSGKIRRDGEKVDNDARSGVDLCCDALHAENRDFEITGGAASADPIEKIYVTADNKKPLFCLRYDGKRSRCDLDHLKEIAERTQTEKSVKEIMDWARSAKKGDVFLPHPHLSAPPHLGAPDSISRIDCERGASHDCEPILQSLFKIDYDSLLNGDEIEKTITAEGIEGIVLAMSTHEAQMKIAKEYLERKKINRDSALLNCDKIKQWARTAQAGAVCPYTVDRIRSIVCTRGQADV